MGGKLTIKQIRKKGRGVFATKRIRQGELIETCPVALFKVPKGECHTTEQYAFRWDKHHVAIALGYGSLYNHSYAPNAAYVQMKKNKTIEVYALRNIRKGEEITFNYNGDPESMSPLWFHVID